jgi:hypothetical protein
MQIDPDYETSAGSLSSTVHDVSPSILDWTISSSFFDFLPPTLDLGFELFFSEELSSPLFASLENTTLCFLGLTLFVGEPGVEGGAILGLLGPAGVPWSEAEAEFAAGFLLDAGAFEDDRAAFVLDFARDFRFEVTDAVSSTSISSSSSPEGVPSGLKALSSVVVLARFFRGLAGVFLGFSFELPTLIESSLTRVADVASTFASLSSSPSSSARRARFLAVRFRWRERFSDSSDEETSSGSGLGS